MGIKNVTAADVRDGGFDNTGLRRRSAGMGRRYKRLAYQGRNTQKGQ